MPPAVAYGRAGDQAAEEGQERPGLLGNSRRRADEGTHERPTLCEHQQDLLHHRREAHCRH